MYPLSGKVIRSNQPKTDRRMNINLSIIIPTFNEVDNIGILIDRLNEMWADKRSYEIIVVDDDSPDKTWEYVQKRAELQENLFCIRRVHERGLSSAVIRGFESARGKNLAVLDADLQHDERLLINMLEAIQEKDLVIGSRKVDEGGISDWNVVRRLISFVATKMAHFLLRTSIKDPMSGFFMVKRHAYEKIAHKLNPSGFKIMLEIAFHLKSDSFVELGYQFRPRERGKSKLSGDVIFDYLELLYELRFGRILPAEFIKYCIIGSIGVAVNFGVLSLALFFGLTDNWSLLFAIEAAIISNFFFNNQWTFKDVKITGFLGSLKGLVKFNAICSVGAYINFATALFIKSNTESSLFMADGVGILITTVWNYMINKHIVWKRR